MSYVRTRSFCNNETLTVEKLKLFFKNNVKIRCKIRTSNNVLEAHHSIGQYMVLVVEWEDLWRVVR